MLNSAKKYLVKLFLSQVKSKTWSHFFYGNPLRLETLKAQYPEFRVSKQTPLCKLMNQHGSDKGIGWHNYTKVYHYLFQDLEVSKLFEMGIGSTNTNLPYNMGIDGSIGASLKAWKKYFPSANIIGADIDQESLFQEDRIATFHCDQTSAESINQMWQSVNQSSFDVIIDDGVHEFEPNRIFFENSIDQLKTGGIYVVEDIQNIELGRWKEIIESDYVNQYPNLLFRICSIPNLFNALDNNLLIVYSL
jgi:SAM-dependent methyltransferase